MPHGWKDAETPIAVMKEQVAAFVTSRGWDEQHSPKNIAMSIGIEAAELMEIFQWVPSQEAARSVLEDRGALQHVKEELSDVVIYCLSMANVLGIDLACSIQEKIASNALRYPPLSRAGGMRESEGSPS